jgi:SAM-dependent methyltransferase
MGELSLERVTLQRVHEGDPSPDVLDGVLRCVRCGSPYPIVAGVALIVEAVDGYMESYSSEIIEATNADSRGLLAALLNAPQHLSASDALPRFHGSIRLNDYICAHYDDLASLITDSNPIHALVNNPWHGNFFDALLDKWSLRLPSFNSALDIGCSVGGLTWRLAAAGTRVYGLDISFAAAHTARQILLSSPQDISTYQSQNIGNVSQVRTLDISRRNNVEIVVGSASNLPFPNEYFDIVACVNLLELMPSPLALLDAAFNAIRPGGFFLFADPYDWRSERTQPNGWLPPGGNEDSAKALRDYLDTKYEIEDEIPNLPWIIRYYERSFMIWLDHCILARKR